MHEARLERMRETREAPRGSCCLTKVPRTHPVTGHPASSASLGGFTRINEDTRINEGVFVDSPPVFAQTLAGASQSAFGPPGAHYAPPLAVREVILKAKVRPCKFLALKTFSGSPLFKRKTQASSRPPTNWPK